jgi:hypothetical protein
LRLAPAPAPAALEFNEAEIDQLARLEHRRWLIERRLLDRAHDEDARAGLRVEWDALPESERERNREDFRRLPGALAASGYEIRRQRRIRAAGAELESSLAALRARAAAPASDETPGLIVLADIDAESGREAAQRALERPDAELWLVSRDGPARFRNDARVMAMSERAAGWLRRDLTGC